MHSGAFQVLICPRPFLIPIWSPGSCILSLPSVGFETGFTSNIRVGSRVVVVFMPVPFPPCLQDCVGCEGVARVSAEELGCRCLPIFLFRVTLASFLFFNTALLEGAKYKSVC